MIAEQTQQLTTLAFIERPGEILLAMKKRGFGAGRWNGYGGKVDEGESVEAAALRELQEESGILSAKLEHRVIQHFLIDEPVKNITCHVFAVTAYEGVPVETEEMKPHWFSIDQIPYNEMWPADEIWLPKYLSGERFSVNFHYATLDTIISHSFGLLPSSIETKLVV